MPSPANMLVELETKFWQSMVDNDVDVATAMLCSPALMVNEHGTIKFNREQYRHMADKGPMKVHSFEFNDMDVVFPTDKTAILTYRVKQDVVTKENGEHIVQEKNDTSTWIHDGKQWLCAMHTEAPARAKQ